MLVLLLLLVIEFFDEKIFAFKSECTSNSS
jgi:hypothetical protein